MAEAYKNPELSSETRAADLLGRMNIDEKIAQLHAYWLLLAPDGNHMTRGDAVVGKTDQRTERSALIHGLGQITRPLGSRPIDPRDGVKALNLLQKFMVEETRLGIPVMSHEECLTGLMIRGATLFPSALAYGATWNPDLLEAVGRAIGEEARSVGCHQGLAPVLDVVRDARWGRNEETFGEDPYLTGILATAYVRGLQGDKRDLLATLKHYVGHSFAEGGRNHAPVNLGWRELNDTFLLPFEMAVKLGNAGSIMPAYHDIDGEPCHASHHLLTQVLRDDWGFDGLIVADYLGISLLYEHHGLAADPAEAIVMAINAGLDIELPGADCATHLKAAYEQGLVTLETIDAAVLRVITEKFRVGLFEKPYVDVDAIALQTDDSVQLAREVARQSIVIAQNDGSLPLGEAPKIALIGPAADDPLALLGDYAFPVQLLLSGEQEETDNVVTPRAALEAHFGADNVIFAQGCNILDDRKFGAPVFPGDIDAGSANHFACRPSTRLDMIGDAVAAANAADIAIVCVGDLSGHAQSGTVGEGSDADSLDLPGVQQILLEAVVATGKPVVVVLSSGRPYTLGGLEDKLAALVWSFFGGQAGGPALVDVLTGAVEPSGRLPLSVPLNVGAVPYFYNHKRKSAGSPPARHFGSRYPFGHGLGYTTFAFDDLKVASEKVDVATGTVVVSFTVRNTGPRDGIAVPQLYVRDLKSSVVRPIRELKAFARVNVSGGAAVRVIFEVPTDMLSFTGLDGKRRVEPGLFDLMVGESSAAIRLSGTVELTGEVRTLDRNWRMTSRHKVEPLLT